MGLDDDEPRISATFRPGDGCSFWIVGDAYPVTVRRVSPSGSVVWVSEDGFHAGREGGSHEVPENPRAGLFVPVESPSATWTAFTRRKSGVYRPRGWESGGLLVHGRSSRQNPSL